MEQPYKYLSNLRIYLYEIVINQDTRLGRVFDITLLWAILLSVVLVMAESVKEINNIYNSFFGIAEWVFTVLFTVEYLLRIFVHPNPKKYIFSFFGIIDLVAVLPTYLTLFLTGGSYLVVIRAVRLLRIFRILKIPMYQKEASFLAEALYKSRFKIQVFLISVTTVVIIMGTLMYLIEGGQNGFTSIPRSIYWAIVTITTVGYGDISPVTEFGQAAAAVLMLIGYAIIAVGIVSSQQSDPRKDKKKVVNDICESCGNGDHLKGSIYCNKCGSKL